MAKKHVYAIIDVESLGTFASPICYDVGVVIADRYCNKPLYSNRWLIKDTIDRKSPYSQRLKQLGKNWWYEKDYETKTKEVYIKNPECYKSFAIAKKEILEILDIYSVNVISAYNLGFDLKALEKTSKLFLKEPFFNKEYKTLCLWNWSTEVLFKQRTYHKVAKEQGWISEAGNLRTTAEHAYRYIAKKYDYIEPHTALEDALIEFEIFKKCVRQKRKIKWGVVSHPWKKAQNPFDKVVTA